MRQANARARQEIFTEEQIRIAVWAVDATYPDVGLGPDFKGAKFKEYPYYEIAIAQNPNIGALFEELEEEGISKGPLFLQPHLETPLEEGQKVPKEVLIVALSDLGGVGIIGKDLFFKEGDDEMRELYGNLRRSDIMQRLVKGDEEQDRADREKVTTAFLGWAQSQSGFAAWQALRFEKILYLLKKQNDIKMEEEQKLRSQFSHFEDNVRASHERVKELKSKFEETKSILEEKAAFLYLAREMHY